MPPSPNSYQLTTHWLVPATIEEVDAVLAEVESFPDWWPEVYLSVRVVDPGGAQNVWRTVEIVSRGWLPYTLRWQARVVEERPPHSRTIEATGDLVGRGEWRLEQRGDVASVTFVWEVLAEKPILRRLSPILKPIFAANHRWAMARGLEGLTRELARRRAAWAGSG